MKKTYNFEAGKWNINDFCYAYSPACKAYKEFIQQDECISNSFNKNINDFDYISIITKEKYKKGVHIHTKCSFDSFGAPLIVLSDDISENKDGKLQYGLHFEVVAYEDGCNVWHIIPYPEREEKPIKPTLIGTLKFKTDDKSLIDIDVTVGEKQLFIEVNDQKFTVINEDIPKTFHIGITACEGINRFYEFSIQE